MAITIVDISPKLENGDADTVVSADMVISLGAGRSSSAGMTLDEHDAGATAYTQQYFEETSPGATNVYSFGSLIRALATGSTTEDFVWSGAMVSSGDGDAVRYALDGTHASNNLDGNSLDFTTTTTPAAVTIAPVPAAGDFIYYFIAFNTGGISADPSGFGSPDVSSEMANLPQGRWYSKISDGTETTVAATLTTSATGVHTAGSQPAAAGGAENLIADSGSYTYTGTAAGLLLSALISGDTEAYIYTGTAADLNLGRTISAETDQYTYTGTAADLTFTSIGNFTLTADTDSYIYTGTAADLFFGANLIADTDQYIYTGTAATLTHNLNLVADTAQYTYTGTVAALQSGRIMISESGSYIITGTAVAFDFSSDIWTDEPNVITTWTAETDKITTWTEQAAASTVWTVI